MELMNPPNEPPDYEYGEPEEDRKSLPNIPVYNISQLLKSWEWHREKMKRCLSVEENYVVLRDWREESGFTYDIEWDRLKTPLELLGWVSHLSQKNWLCLIQLGRFVDLVASRNKWNIH